MPTVLPFHRAVVRDEAFTGEPFSVHTRWIETEFGTQIPPYVPEADSGGDRTGTPGERERIVVEVGGKRLEVVLLYRAERGGRGRPAAGLRRWPGGPAGVPAAVRPVTGRRSRERRA